MLIASYIILYFNKSYYVNTLFHLTMKNEGWGIKEDQIPSSSHLLQQTMDSQLQLLNYNQ